MRPIRSDQIALATIPASQVRLPMITTTSMTFRLIFSTCVP
nr:hypothetical protein [Nonomuraea sp. WAC 01424]